jgi:hypothetical protein
MKRWTWLAMMAATGACSYPTGEFTLGTARPDVPTTDNVRVDSGTADVPAPTDLGRVDAPATPDAGATDASDAALVDVPAVDAADADWEDAGSDDVTDAGAADTGTATDAGPAGDSPCPAGRVLCGESCVDPLNDINHCGRCNFACNGTNGSAACAAGRCEVTCRAGFADCDMDPRNGCEVGLGTITNCRSCADVCPSGAALNGTPACTANVCRTSCNAGFGDCNGNPADGCELPLSSPANCGACGRACPAGQSCAAGVCTVSCSAPNLACAGACVDPQTSPTNCGMCGRACVNPPNAVGACRAGACGIGACNAGFADCNGVLSDGCERPLNTIADCGACGRACAFPNGIAACTSGACVMTGCSARNFRDCDANAATGCERDINTDTTNCGACGAVCRSHVGSSTPCSAGVCAPTCNPGYANCNGIPGDGCEVSLATNLNCGVCGRACLAGQLCRSGACVAAPAVNYARTAVALAFVDVCAAPGAVHLLPSLDDNGALTPLPFNFSYWGAALAAGTMINVSTNGFISLDGAVNNSLQGLVPDPAPPNGVIAAWWTDLFTSPAGICVATLGAAPARRYVVQWNSVLYYANRASDMNFEVILNESGGAIDLVYQRLAPLPTGYVPTVGLESNTGVQGSFICTTANTSCGVVAGNAFRFTPM